MTSWDKSRTRPVWARAARRGVLRRLLISAEGTRVALRVLMLETHLDTTILERRSPELRVAEFVAWTRTLLAEDVTHGEGLLRLCERLLRRRLTTREYVAVQDLAALTPDSKDSAIVREWTFAAKEGALSGACVELLASLGEALEEGSGFEGGVRVLVEVRRSWLRGR